jgi:hypothetical protein
MMTPELPVSRGAPSPLPSTTHAHDRHGHPAFSREEPPSPLRRADDDAWPGLGQR